MVLGEWSSAHGPTSPRAGPKPIVADGHLGLIPLEIDFLILYICGVDILYTSPMDVAVSELRAHLSEWLEQARHGNEVVVTDRGVPVARLLGMDATDTLERLTVEGVIARPERSKRPKASGRGRPQARTNMADLISEQRR